MNEPSISFETILSAASDHFFPLKNLNFFTVISDLGSVACLFRFRIDPTDSKLIGIKRCQESGITAD